MSPRRPASPAPSAALVAARAAGEAKYGRRLHAVAAALRVAQAHEDADRTAALQAEFDGLALAEFAFHQRLYAKAKPDYLMPTNTP